MTKYGVIGLGYWGKNHLRALVKLRKQNLIDEIIVCDTDENALKRAQKFSEISICRNWKQLLEETKDKFVSRLTNILIIVLPVYLIIALISDMGFFLWLRKSLTLGVTSTFVPVEAMSIVIFSLVAEFTSGYAAAGAMLDAGTLTVSQTVLALLLGNIIAAPVRALRHQVPYYMGIFNPGLGTYLVIISQAFRLVSLIVIALIFLLGVNMFGFA